MTPPETASARSMTRNSRQRRPKRKHSGNLEAAPRELRPVRYCQPTPRPMASFPWGVRTQSGWLKPAFLRMQDCRSWSRYTAWPWGYGSEWNSSEGFVICLLLSRGNASSSFSSYWPSFSSGRGKDGVQGRSHQSVGIGLGGQDRVAPQRYPPRLSVAPQMQAQGVASGAVQVVAAQRDMSHGNWASAPPTRLPHSRRSWPRSEVAPCTSLGIKQRGDAPQ